MRKSWRFHVLIFLLHTTVVITLQLANSRFWVVPLGYEEFSQDLQTDYRQEIEKEVELIWEAVKTYLCGWLIPFGCRFMLFLSENHSPKSYLVLKTISWCTCFAACSIVRLKSKLNKIIQIVRLNAL